MKSTKSTKKALAFFMSLCMVLTMVGGLLLTAHGDVGLIPSFIINETDTDKVYFAGNTLSFTVSHPAITTAPGMHYLIEFGA